MPSPRSRAGTTGRNYAPFRYMLASGLGWREPIMFNGGVLTFDPVYASKKFEGPGYTPDHRQWGAALISGALEVAEVRPDQAEEQ